MIQTTQAEREAFFAQLMPLFLEYLVAHSTPVGDIEEVQTLDGIKSLPARYVLGGVEKTVSAPLKLLTANVDEATAVCQAAALSANTAASDANAAAKKVNDAIIDISAEKQAAQQAAASANTAAASANTAKTECEAATAETDAAIEACAASKEECDAATADCITATAQCREATTAAIKATADTNETIAKVVQATANANGAASGANTARDGANLAAAAAAEAKKKVDDLMPSLNNAIVNAQNAYNLATSIEGADPYAQRPSSMLLEYPSVVPVGATSEIRAFLYPPTAQAAIIFALSKPFGEVNCDGKVTSDAQGTAKVNVFTPGNATLRETAIIVFRPFEVLELENGEVVTIDGTEAVEV